MRLQSARVGDIIQIRERPASFSFFPTYQGATREGVHSILFATNPWHIIRHHLEAITDQAAQRQALAFLTQARDFFTAAENSDVSAAKPLLLYYSFLNLAKALIVKKRGAALTTLVKHGLSEKLPTTIGAIHGNVSIDISQNPGSSAFVMFATALGATLPTPTAPNTHLQMRSQDFLSQILIGHRVFCQAENIKERFVSLDCIDYMENTVNDAWLRARAYADDFTRLGYPMTSLSRSLNGTLTWQNVSCTVKNGGRRIIEAETTTIIHYGHRPSQVIGQLSRQARLKLWRSATAYPPYRKYYIYLSSPTQILLDQLLTIYLATFYFGSITRYKPEQFDYILKSPIGPFVFEFFSNQPSQFLYLIASEFIEQEVARAAII